MPSTRTYDLDNELAFLRSLGKFSHVGRHPHSRLRLLRMYRDALSKRYWAWKPGKLLGPFSDGGDKNRLTLRDKLMEYVVSQIQKEQGK